MLFCAAVLLEGDEDETGLAAVLELVRDDAGRGSFRTSSCPRLEELLVLVFSEGVTDERLS
jgi:hypothetical protein